MFSIKKVYALCITYCGLGYLKTVEVKFLDDSDAEHLIGKTNRNSKNSLAAACKHFLSNITVSDSQSVERTVITRDLSSIPRI